MDTDRNLQDADISLLATIVETQRQVITAQQAAIEAQKQAIELAAMFMSSVQRGGTQCDMGNQLAAYGGSGTGNGGGTAHGGSGPLPTEVECKVEVESIVPTLAEAAQRYVETASKRLKTSTLAAYEYSLDKRLLPALGHIRLDALNTSVMQNFVDSLSSELSGKTIRDLCTLVRVIINQYARVHGDFSPQRMLLKYPKDNYKPESEKFWTFDELNQIEHWLMVDMHTPHIHKFEYRSGYALLYLIMMHTGLRVGEATALRWRHIRMDSRVIEVRATASRVYYQGEDKYYERTPKSAHSMRDVPISAALYGILMDVTFGDPDSYVAITCQGNPTCGNVLRTYFRENCCKELSLTYKSAHSFRHSWITHTIGNGASINAIAALAGHSSPSVTLDVYTHVTNQSRQRAVEKFPHMGAAHTAPTPDKPCAKSRKKNPPIK